MKRTVFILVCVALTFIAYRCANRSSPKKQSDFLTIAVIPKSTDHDYWKSVRSGAKTAAKEFDVRMVWKGTKVEDVSRQIDLVNRFVDEDVDAIVIAPVDENALVEVCESASKKGVKIVVIDSMLNSDVALSFVATDNYEAGRLCARRVKDMIEGKGRVLLLRHVETGSASTEYRVKGFTDEAKDAGRKFKLIAPEVYSGPTVEGAYIASLKILEENENVDAIFCPNESTTRGMLKAIKEKGIAGKVRFLGFDSSIDLLLALDDGHINGLALQDPEAMGYAGVLNAYNAVKGFKVEKRVDTGVAIASRTGF